MGEQLYHLLWKKRIADILDLVEHFSTGSSIQLAEEDFQALGNRKDYTFNLVLVDGKATNGISGSAVARDLAEVISSDAKALARLKGKTVKINMDRHYTLHINNQC